MALLFPRRIRSDEEPMSDPQQSDPPQPSSARPDPLDADRLWAAIAEILSASPQPKLELPKAEAGTDSQKKWKRLKTRVLILDIIAIVLWGYALTKLFIADIDRAFVGWLTPTLSWLLDLRFFLALAALALILALFRGWKIALSLMYIAGFPVVVLAWKIPKAIVVRLRRPAVALGILNVIFNAFLGFKRVVIGLAASAICVLLILLAPLDGLVIAGMTGLSVILVIWLVLAVRRSLEASRFIVGQQRMITKIVDSKFFDNYKVAPADTDLESVRGWNVERANQFVANAGVGLLTYRSAYYWAFTLDQYRRGATRVLFSGISVASLFLQVAAAFGFLNFGLHRVEPTQYLQSSDPSLWTFFYYSLAGSFFGEISTIVPVGDVAVGLKIANGVLGSLLVLTLVTSIFLVFRQSRSDETSTEAINGLKAKADEFGESVGGSFATSVQDLEARLAAIGWGLLGATKWLAARVPGDWKS